jgi:pimeloyl-ACP methyl ester carboxylesterase
VRRPAARAGLALAALAIVAAGCRSAGGPRGPAAGYDPLAADPPPGDPPAALVELSFASSGERLNGIAYLAAGPGPHPTVVLLHGFPGNERNLDLAQVLRRDGWNVVFFHDRGAWGSGGTFSFQHALEDVAAVLRMVRWEPFARAQRIDPRRVVLVGHSMGGFLALAATSEDPDVRCAASIAGANLGAFGRGIAADPALRAAAVEAFGAGSGPLRGISGTSAADELAANAERWDLVARAASLATRPLLLVAADHDTATPPADHHAPLVAALHAAGASAVAERVLPTDHAFSDQRVALARAVLAFLDARCR